MKKISDMTPLEQEELRADATALINSTAMRFVFEELQEEYLHQLIHAEVGGLTAQAAHASMKSLAEVQARLQVITKSNQVLKPRNPRNS